MEGTSHVHLAIERAHPTLPSLMVAETFVGSLGCLVIQLWVLSQCCPPLGQPGTGIALAPRHYPCSS